MANRGSQLGSSQLGGFGLAGREEIIEQQAHLSFVGKSQKSIAKTFIAAFSFTSSSPRKIVIQLIAALSFIGSIASRTTIRVQTAALGFSGSVQSRFTKALETTLSFAGSSGRSILHQLRAELSFVGSLFPHSKFVRVLVATLSFSGHTRSNIGRAFSAALRFAGSTNFEKVLRLKPILDILILRHEELPTLTLLQTEGDEVYGLINHLSGYPKIEFQSIVTKRKVFDKGI